MIDRIRFITHQGKQILLVDLSTCLAAEVEEILRALPDVVTARPLLSVLALSDFTGASFDAEGIRVLKKPPPLTSPLSRSRHSWEQRTFLMDYPRT